MWKDNLLARIATPREFRSAYDAGYHAARRGPDLKNCHFGWFATKASSDEWSRGNRDGKESFKACGFGIPASNGS